MTETLAELFVAVICAVVFGTWLVAVIGSIREWARTGKWPEQPGEHDDGSW